MYHLESGNEQFQFFATIVNSVVDECLPLKRVKIDSSDKPWITQDIKSLIAKRQRAWSSGNFIMFKYYRNKVNYLCKKARGSFFTDNIAAVQESNPKKWWAAVKSSRQTCCTHRLVRTVLPTSPSPRHRATQRKAEFHYNFKGPILYFLNGCLNS